MAYPSPPTSLYINGHPESTDKITGNYDGTVSVSAKIDDPNPSDKVRLLVRYSKQSNFSSYQTAYSSFGRQGVRHSATMKMLERNTLYHVRAYTQQRDRYVLSKTYNSTSFWTNRFPLAPTIVTPPDNFTFLATAPLVMDWQVNDPDDDTPTQRAFQIRYRVAGTPIIAAGPWTYKKLLTATTTYTFPANTFKASTEYEWQVQTQDPQYGWGEYSPVQSFSMEGPTKPPLLVSPYSDVVVLSDGEITFRWVFRDPDATATQGNADIRYRVVGTDVWIEVNGVDLTDSEWTFAPDTFTSGYRYEWQVRTQRAAGLDPESDWSSVGTFWTILTPGAMATSPFPNGESDQAELGCGQHRVFVFDRGGVINRGEITPITSIKWGRKRDDISDATIVITEYDKDCGDLLATLRSWRHEVVIYRNDDRVWEGPITHLAYRPGEVTIGAKDPMAYVYRRILRQGYNDSNHNQTVGGVTTQLGLKTVVERASLILQNALGYLDPNVLPYLTAVTTGEDARQSRIVPDFTKTAWEEIDDLAANAGLDYTTVGRRIILWDTHTHIGILPEMRDESFSDSPIVTEYGMNLANYYAVTDGQGAWGAAIPASKTEQDWYDYYGPLEQLASGYGDAAVTPDTLSASEYAAHIEDLKQQARRNIDGRYPTPLVARVPDNSTIKPDAPIGINHLIPGVWIPLRVENIVRPFGQVQKLDSINVEQDGAGERVQVVMSPAPQAWADPDAATDAETVDE